MNMNHNKSVEIQILVIKNVCYKKDICVAFCYVGRILYKPASFSHHKYKKK